MYVHKLADEETNLTADLLWCLMVSTFGDPEGSARAPVARIPFRLSRFVRVQRNDYRGERSGRYGDREMVSECLLTNAEAPRALVSINKR